VIQESRASFIPSITDGLAINEDLLLLRGIFGVIGIAIVETNAAVTVTGKAPG
jgi:hypothetical protein